ncbi:MAG: hypothetical protein U0840_26445 [Gemmataceae bacterium]
MFRTLWKNEAGSSSPEWALVVSILVLAAVCGIFLSQSSAQLEEQAREPAALVR